MMAEEQTKRFMVSGMSCAACSARVEKAVRSLEGVSSCSVNLLTGDLFINGSVENEDVVNAVTCAGYGCVISTGETAPESADEKNASAETTEAGRIKKRLILSLCLLLPLMYLSMGIGMLGLPAPSMLKSVPVNSVAQMLISAAVIFFNRSFFISGFMGIRKKAPNMNTLVALGSGISWVWSAAAVVRVFILINSGLRTEEVTKAAAVLQKELYFESAAMILVLITVGKLLEARSKGKTTNAVNSLIKLRPDTAVRLDGDREETVPVSSLKPGDLIAVRPGASVPADAVILKGSSLLDESMITGESTPVEKRAVVKNTSGEDITPANRVFAATINKNGYLVCRVESAGEETVLSQIIRMVMDASASKAPAARFADKVAGVFVPVVLVLALITFTVWMLIGENASTALSRAISVLVISCPCALGLATPVAVMVGTGVGAKNGILYKSSEVMETAAGVKIAVFDKTGTLTTGKPVLTDVLPAQEISAGELLNYACSIESASAHPIASAVMEYGKRNGAEIYEVSDFIENGSSVMCRVKDGKLTAGGRKTMLSAGVSEEQLAVFDPKACFLSDSGKTPVYFALNDKCIGILACEDKLRTGIRECVEKLGAMGIRVVLLTGDNEKTALAVAKKAGIRDVAAGVIPSGKAEMISELKRQGRVMMIGDGINDAPALKTADIGVAVASGTDVAMDAADIVLMKSEPSDIPAAIRLSRAVLKNIRQNLFWAFFYNVLCIPLAAGVYVRPFGLSLSPMIGAAAMSLSSIFVVTNALRLNRVRLYDCETGGISETEESGMVETLNVQGMMCCHCEAGVKAALEAIDGVEKAEVSHEKGTAVVTGSASREELVKAVVAAGYEVI